MFAKLFGEGDHQVLARFCLNANGAPRIVIHFGPEGQGEFEMRFPNTEPGHKGAREALIGLTEAALLPFAKLVEGPDPFAGS